MPTESATFQFIWATGWMLTRRHASSSELCDIRVWRAEAGVGTPLLWGRNDQLTWLYFGSQPPACLQDSARSTAWIERCLDDPRTANSLSGVFALLVVDSRSGRVVVAADRLGVQPVYYQLSRDGVAHIATHLMWLLVATNHDGAIDDESFFTHFAFGYPVSDTQTPYKDVRRLVPAGWLESSGDRTAVGRYWQEAPAAVAPQIPELASLLRESLRERPIDWPVFLPLTAGKDSLCLAAVAPEEAKICAGTFGAAQSADRLQGEQLAAALHVPHGAVGLCGPSSLAKWMSYVSLHSGGLATASYADMARFVGTLVPRSSPVVLGEGGECVREFFRTAEGPLDSLSREYMTPPDFLRQTLRTECSEVLNNYPASLLERVRRRSRHRDDASFAIDFYRSVRMPGNFSLRHSVLSTIRPKISPFLDRQFIEQTYGLPGRWFQNSTLHRSIIETVKPEWLHFFDRPVESAVTTQRWEKRVQGRLGAELARQLTSDLQWSDDVFDLRGVAGLMARTIARPDRAIHHLLRIASFAAGRRMMRADGKRLAQHVAERTFTLAGQQAADPAARLSVGQPEVAVS